MTSDGWRNATLGDFIEVRHGYAFKTKFADDQRSPYALFTRKNFTPGGGYRDDAPRYYHGEFRETFLLEAGDLMIVLTDLSRDGDLLGFPAIVPETDTFRYLHNQRVGKVVFHAPGLDPQFLYGLLRSSSYRRHVLNTASQTTVRDTAPSRLHAYTFRLPPLHEQARIARILAALDDKIESDRRLAVLLEATAASLFRARFVDFVGVDEFEDSDIGRVPAGWAVKPLSFAVEINPAVPIRKGDLTPFIEMSAVGAWTTRPHAIGRRPYGGGARFEPRDTLMAKITGCIEHGKGAFADFVDGPASGSTEFLVFRAKPPLTPEEVFLLSRTDRVRAHAIANMTGSSGRQRVPSSCFDTLLVAVPPEGAKHGSAEFFKAAFCESRGLWHEERTLRTVRDALLPKLVSGEIRVPDTADPTEVIERGFGELAAS